MSGGYDDNNLAPPVRQNVAGGDVTAIIPQNLDEIWRVSKYVFAGGLSPASLTKGKTEEAAISAVAVCIMAGAELGMKPMMALRSFTVIGGKPALYGDGLINVVRSSGKAAFIETGYVKNNRSILRAAGVLPSAEDEAEFPGCTEEAYKALTEDERTFGFCKAKRNDTDEIKVTIFTVDDAKRAGLYQDQPIVNKQVWENRVQVWRDVPNDSPWYRFYKRMYMWRAAGYCLRELFADVLGGIRDEFEQREISDIEGMRDITPTSRKEPPAPDEPPPPPEDEVTTKEPPAPIDGDIEPPKPKPAKKPTEAKKPERVIDAKPEPGKPQAENSGAANEPFDLTAYLDRLEADLGATATVEDFEEAWGSRDPMATLEGDDVGQAIANGIYNRIQQEKGF